MRKALSALMCYAFGIVAHSLCAATPELSVYTQFNFSNSDLWGETPVYGLPDTKGGGSYYWFYFGDYGNSSQIRNYDKSQGDVSQYNRFDKSTNPQPRYMEAGQANQGFLDFFNDMPLARAFESVDESGRSSMVTVSDSDVFVDSLVKFTARNEPISSIPTEDVDGKAKFMCWLSAPDGASSTNLVVTAGRLDASGNPYRANYLTTAKVETNRWYRLTARMIANAATASDEKVTAFALYLDGEQVVCDASDYAIGDDAAEMVRIFAGNEHYARCGLFPSMLPARSKTGLYGVAVQGEGAIDEIGLVDSGNPLLSEKVSKIVATVAADAAKVASISCTVTAAFSPEPHFVTNVVDASEVSFTVYEGATIRVYPETRPGYALLETLKISGNSAAVQSVSGYEVTLNSDDFSDDAALVLRVNTRDAFYRVGDTSYQTFDEAQKAAQKDASRKVTLETDITLDPDSEQGQMRIAKANELVIDLNGCHIKGENFLDEAAIYNQGRLTVLDSVGGGSIEASGEAIETVSSNDALEVNYTVARLTMGSETVTNEFRVLGRVRVTDGELVIKAGDYLTPPDESAESFYLESYLAPGRFSAVRHDVAGEGAYYRIVFDGRVKVDFKTPVGSVTPESVIVDYNSHVSEPTLVAPGYAATGWYETGSATPFDFAATQVTNDLTLTAQVEATLYTIENDYYKSGFPTSYRVTDDKQTLPVPTRRNFTFGGWRDSVSERFVEAVGAGATFVGTETVVTGNLDLVSVWVPQSIVWSNVASGLVESNGVYAGSLPIAIPVGNGLTRDKKVAIDEIAFGIVNPLLFPKTAPCLALTNASGKVVSAERVYETDPTTGEFVVGDQRLSNGRAKVAYRFTGLEVDVGKTNGIFFCNLAGLATNSVLRLTAVVGDEVIGPCSGDQSASAIERYSEYVPVYEVTGHEVEGDDE